MLNERENSNARIVDRLVRSSASKWGALLSCDTNIGWETFSIISDASFSDKWYIIKLNWITELNILNLPVKIHIPEEN